MAAWTQERLLGFSRSPWFGWSGPYKVEGQTLKGGNAFQAQVVLFDQLTMTVIREVWSAADGSWSFDLLAPGTYLVLAIDRTGTRNAVVYSDVVSVAM